MNTFKAEGLSAASRLSAVEAVACARWTRISQEGQGTVEYAVVLAAFMAIVVALGALWHFLDAGTVVQHALQSASHHLQAVAAGAIGDVFQY